MALFNYKSFDYLPNFKFSSILSIPAQLIGNSLVTVANTVNTVLEVASPIGLAGNSLLGKPFQAVHQLGDQIIASVTKTVSQVGTSLGATVEASDSHHKNEWLDQDLKLDNILSLPTELIGNVVVGATTIANDVLDAAAPIALVGNQLIPGFKVIHKAGDTLIEGASDALNTIGQTLGASIEVNTTHYDNEWKKETDQVPNSDTSTNSTSNLVQIIQGQKSYKVSDSVYEKVEALKAEFLKAPSLQVNNLWRPIYTEIRNDLIDNPEVDQGTKNWLKVAEAVATADPKSFLYQYVRLGTGKSLADKGITVTDPQFYQASNVLIKTLTENFLNGVTNDQGETVVPQGYLPSANGKYGLVHMDATQALENLGGELGDWTGITPASLLDHYLGVDTSELNGGDSRPLNWYLELLGDVVKANLKGGASLADVIGQITTEGLNFIGQFAQGELLQVGFSSKDQLVNTLTQIAYAYAGDFAGSIAVATNILNPNTNIITTLNPFGQTLTGKSGHDLIKGNFGNDKLYGGAGDDLIFGQWGNDLLDGGEGVNVLVGGRGNDQYYVHSNADFTLEHRNEGLDTVFSAASHHHLAKNIENLILQGHENIKGSGNELDNSIVGNSGNNELYGLAGNDLLDANGGLFNILNGGTGDDVLKGSLGNDTYVFELAFGHDTLYEKGGDDTIQFGKGININDLILQKNANDLTISLSNSTDSITIKDWSVHEGHSVESIVFHSGERVDLNLLEQQHAII